MVAVVARIETRDFVLRVITHSLLCEITVCDLFASTLAPAGKQQVVSEVNGVVKAR
jgi:hypothetical protein